MAHTERPSSSMAWDENTLTPVHEQRKQSLVESVCASSVFLCYTNPTSPVWKMSAANHTLGGWWQGSNELLKQLSSMCSSILPASIKACEWCNLSYWGSLIT